MDKRYLKNNHDENVVEKRRNGNCVNIRSVLIFDRNLIGGDEVVRSSSFLTCRHDCGRDYRSTILRGDHHCDVVWWSRWSELGGTARDVVWWSELGGAARDVVDVV